MGGGMRSDKQYVWRRREVKITQNKKEGIRKK